ncbi:MAG TPA: carboxypeptidase-like regulatory domain-containing protein [Candidatus Acidoferrales bacterium]|nr:carboxypeptidase-like regulatory domain-containing protein [Candidatus Acidoferrales bacterium]
MNRFRALFLISLFIIGIVAVGVPVQATFTLGDLTGTSPYRINDFDPHVPGVIGYVWPGAGQCAWDGYPNQASDNCSPGYQAPYPSGNPPGAPSNSWYQLEGNSYAPFGAILTGSTGDLIFALNATACADQGYEPTPSCAGPHGAFTGRWDGVDILIPPGFAVPGDPQIISTITNDYSAIAVSRISPNDRYAPGWTLVRILADAGMSAASPVAPGGPIPRAGPSTPYYDHQGIDFTALGEWYYIRINGVLAPSDAGRYFFKILLEGGTPSICGEEGTGTGTGSLLSLTSLTSPSTGNVPAECSQFIPTENWPVMLVKGEVDPAIMTGTIRYAGYNATLYGQPVQEAGRVWAKMTMRLDPYTGQQRPDLPTIDAIGYFNATATGHYEVEGLAPGIYDLYASAAGFPQSLCQSGVTVLRGQSLHFDCYLQPGPVIHGNLFTKHQFGDEPWPLGDTGITCPTGSTDCTTGQDITGVYAKIELYDGPTLNHIPDPSANLVSWSPLPCIAGGQEFYTGFYTAGNCNDPRLGSKVAFPWHEYTPSNGYGVPNPTTALTSGYYQVAAGTDVAGSGLYYNNLMQDPQGVGPPQHWYVQGGTTTPFHFEFGVKGEYGAPRDLDGMVPQVYATWVNGLTPGRYYVRAWVFRYVQSALDGATFQEYYFDVTPNEWAGDVTLPIDLRLASWINKTVYFHDTPDTITTSPIDTGAGVMSGVLVDANGNVWSYNQTLLGYEGSYSAGERSGWGAAAFFLSGTVPGNTVHDRNDMDKARVNAHAVESGRANIQFWGWNDTWGGEDYGIPSGTYTPHVYVAGYIERGPPDQVSVTLSGNPTEVSDHMYRGAGLNVTVYSIDWERPTVSRNWVWGNPVGYTDTPGGFPTSRGDLPNFPGDPRVNANPASLCALSPGIQGNTGLGLFNNVPTGCIWMVGQEIDLGLYANGTLIDFIGDEPSDLQDTVLTSCLFQSNWNSSIQMCGGGWSPEYLDQGVLVPYQANANDAYFGQELSGLGYVGGYTGGISYFSTRSVLFAPAHWSPTTLSDGGTYEQAVTGYLPLYPSAIPTGQYNLKAYTYGYIQDQTYTAYAQLGQVADIRLNLVIGVNVTLNILFKKESIITPTDMNMSARVRLFDDSGNLVGEWMSSEGTYTTGNGFASAADGTDQYPFGPLHPAVPVPELLNTYNYVPGGVTMLHVLIAGVPQVPAAGTDDGTISQFVPQQAYMNDPLFATTICGFQVNCYTAPGTGLGVGVPGYFANSGIAGASDYSGGWTAEVDFVPWYANNTSTPELAAAGTNCVLTPIIGSTILDISSPTQCPTNLPFGGTNTYAQYYPPVNGLLMGESYHIIPGTTATSGISLTEDTALKPELIGHSLAANHLGPYSQEGVWQIAGTHNSGEASGIFEVDLNGFISGNALAFTYANEFRTLSWGAVNVVAASSTNSSGMNFYTYDGVYQAYLPPGQYMFTISSPGYAPQTWSVSVTPGETGTGQNVYLEQSQIPVPEFSGVAVVAISALAASVYLLKRRRK